MPQGPNELRLLFWETTTACNLQCVHCRASATEARPPDELTFEQARALLTDIASFSSPVIVLSGGEPLIREDMLAIASFGTGLGLRVVLATNGTLVTPELARRMASSGIARISVSIDGADAAGHDAFRGSPGAFDAALAGIEAARAAGLPVQINTTIARHNLNEARAILDLAERLGACALHLFLLVPTGCGKALRDTEMISAEDYERVLNWLYDASRSASINLKATCAPHYFRIMRERSKHDGASPARESHGLEAATKGCLAGSAVCFVSYRGDVYPCGYLPVSAGNVLATPIERIWNESELFAALRDPSRLEGKCGRCEYRIACGGCRARAYAESGSWLAEEPCCAYQPRG